MHRLAFALSPSAIHVYVPRIQSCQAEIILNCCRSKFINSLYYIVPVSVLELVTGVELSRLNCRPNTFHPSRDPSTGWRCHSAAGVIPLLVSFCTRISAGIKCIQGQSSRVNIDCSLFCSAMCQPDGCIGWQGKTYATRFANAHICWLPMLTLENVMIPAYSLTPEP